MLNREDGPVEEINRHSFVVERHGRRYEVWIAHRVLADDAADYADSLWEWGVDGVKDVWGAREMKEDE